MSITREWKARFRKGAKRIKHLVWYKTLGLCHYCGCHLNADTWSIDHVIPVTEGGTNDLSNLVPACKACNQSKGAASGESFKAITVNTRHSYLLDLENAISIGCERKGAA